MANLIHLFKVGQKVRCNMDGTFYKGTVKETYTDHIIVAVSYTHLSALKFYLLGLVIL